MLRRIRLTASYACLALCLLFAVSWVDSQSSELVVGTRVLPNHFMHVNVCIGRLFLLLDRSPPREASLGHSHSTYFRARDVQRLRDFYLYAERQQSFALGAYARLQGDVMFFRIRHWSPILGLSLLAILLRPKPRWRLKLYEYFMFTGIAAITVGGYVALTREIASWSSQVPFYL